MTAPAPILTTVHLARIHEAAALMARGANVTMFTDRSSAPGIRYCYSAPRGLAVTIFTVDTEHQLIQMDRLTRAEFVAQLRKILSGWPKCPLCERAVPPEQNDGAGAHRVCAARASREG